ncbi:MAG TPA: hypothetical protein VN861_14640 [Candidatus Acidoferrales bacterium]|jgi:hypothetical protein|nr:hypothetical protein [Candidatus Acidoferrales bacterium]
MTTVAGAGAQAAPQGGGGGMNPFQIATNLYAEKNLNGLVSSQLLTTSPIPGGGQINAGQYLRGTRLVVRTVTAGAGIPTTGDNPLGGYQGAANAGAQAGVFSQLDLVNVDGSEILYNMSGIAYYLGAKAFRPWLQDWATAYDFVSSATQVGFTAFLQPEIRFSACTLANTDTRSQYRWDQSLLGFPGATTQPTISVTPYMDAWAQPDDKDLQGTANQPVPPGVNLQMKRRHQIFTLNAGGSDNVLLSALTGNAVRAMLLITRDTTGARQAIFSDPFYWTQDNRSLGKLNPDIITQWSNDFYSTYGKGTAFNPGPTTPGGTAPSQYQLGVYPLPRFMEPGSLVGQGWLYTSNATKIQFESTSQTLGSGTPGTCELITDEVYPVGPVDPSLVDI